MANTTRLNVLITGASSGFGKMIAQTLAKAGHRVFATMRGVDGKNAKAARESREWGRREGVAIEVLELDVRDEASVEAAVKAIVASAGGIDVVVNNAGVLAIGLLEAFSIEQVRRLFDANVFGALRVNRAVLPYMRERRSGLLIYISSTAARVCSPFIGSYNAAKAASESIAETLRYELASFGIESAIVEPGAYLTGFERKAEAPAGKERLAGYGPMAEAPRQVFAELEARLSGPGAPDPREVADAVKELIETPAGRRPLRTVVGTIAVKGVADLNKAAEKSQSEFMRSMGMSSGPAGPEAPVGSPVTGA
ncbi:MAG: SDR family oxidoreductase [Elusimicrobiota bacterium]